MEKSRVLCKLHKISILTCNVFLCYKLFLITCNVPSNLPENVTTTEESIPYHSPLHVAMWCSITLCTEPPSSPQPLPHYKTFYVAAREGAKENTTEYTLRDSSEFAGATDITSMTAVPSSSLWALGMHLQLNKIHKLH